MSSKYDAKIFDAFNMSGNPANDATAPAGVELRQYFLGVPVSYKINEKHAIGITPTVVIQSFDAYGGEPFQQVSIHPDSVTNNGTDWSDGLGVKLGWYGKLTDNLSVGAVYQPRINMNKFNKYKGLFSEEGDFDIPATGSIGLAYKIKPTLITLFDYQHIAYSDVNSLGNSNDVAFVTTPPPFTTLPSWLGQTSGAGGGWKDADIYKLGVEWKYSKHWEFRAGYSWMNSLIPESQALINIVAPAVNEEHYSLGASYNIDNESILNFALTHSPEVRTDGYNTNLGGVTGQQGEIYMEQTELSISYSWTF